MMRLVQLTFRDGTPPEELAWTTIVLIPKGKEKFWGIGLVKVVWKVCATVVNCRLRQEVVLHDDLHRFIGGRGKDTATLEAKLSQQITGLTHKPLFQVFWTSARRMTPWIGVDD